ncbi:uncharacterized protein K460DRAFT_407893 [Cucurbitaria berberidis CBS 394.84]|uniref:Fungal N-terminal domain-containing protein n=1 Tax=Cucurbitaria berberidis CBS 394.84 TaxID=1168544 RepID=A0A9P4GDY0_9PLEO|nr:uncharacterized protein K460DRAFT_407893 [Cucurbitaria berberidis CBS 394.84]KAF1843551.1 hypothetical protein K460DRAFT_407893 [Cucurbitaria berberidis CBS 394.84]
MALEIAAAIIGILAAAGKVAEILGPVVSTLKDASKNANAVLSEVNNSRIILVALQKYLDDLDTAPRGRRELIQVAQLITALTDGVLLFSHLEGLVIRLDADNIWPKRIQWARNDKKLASLVARMQCFKSSISVMLNILQCESDLEAHRSRELLSSITSDILKSNLELSRRIAYLEECFDTSKSMRVYRPVGFTQTGGLPQNAAIERLQETNTRLSLGSLGAAQNFQFESDLKSSRVYRKAKRHTADYSFRSSIALSHAWSSMSDISLSDISVVSVVALPITLDDVGDLGHYTFRDVVLEDTGSVVDERHLRDKTVAKSRNSPLQDPTPSTPTASLPITLHEALEHTLLTQLSCKLSFYRQRSIGG